MEPPNATHRGGNIEWKKKALERSYHAGQRYSKHLRKMNKFVPRLKTRADATKPDDAEVNQNLACEENIRLNSLISNLTERSEFGITMEEEDDISDGLLPDGLVETMTEDSVSELSLLGVPRDVAAMSPEESGCVTIDGFAFRTLPTEGSKESASSWVKTEPDHDDVKPSVDELNRIWCPTKTTDITKIKGWRNKVFADNDELIVKQESEENWDADNSLVDEARPLNVTQSAASVKNDTKKATLLNRALTLPYTKTKPAVPMKNISPKKQARFLYYSTNNQTKKLKLISPTSTAHIQSISKSPAIPQPASQPIAGNLCRKPKTKAEYRRMLEEAARSSEVGDVDEAPVAPPVVVPRPKSGQLPTDVDKSEQAMARERIDKRLKSYQNRKELEVKLAAKHVLDARYMYALVDGRPIKIGGSVVAKMIADTKMMANTKMMADTKLAVAAKRVKTLPPKVVDARYTSLLPQSETPKPPVPKVKKKNRGRPLSKKQTQENRLDQFCLRLHPAVGFPLTESAFEQISLLRDDRMEVNDEWINFAISVVNSNKKAHYHRKGFVDNVVPTSDILLPVTRTGDRYELGDMENFNTINVPTAEVAIDESEMYLQCEENLKDLDTDTSEIHSLLRSMVDSVARQEAVEDLHLLAEPEREPWQSKESPSEPHDFLNPTRAAAHPRKRRSALNSELRRLNVLVIEERDADVDETPVTPAQSNDAPACEQEHCKFGCLCHSLERSATETNHCGRPDCMFECVCGRSLGTEEHSILPKSVVSKINESTKYLARTEKEFQRAVVCNKNEMLVVDGCAAPTTGRRKREVKLPLRFRESGIDDKLLFGGNANLEVMEARKNERKVEETESESADIKADVPADSIEEPVFGIDGRPFFVPNHVKHSAFFRRRAENRILEQRHAKAYRLKSCKVVIYRAKLDNVQPLCILHNMYECPCLEYLSPLPAEASHDSVSPTRSPGRKPSAKSFFHGSVGKRRNVAVKKTAPRYFPTLLFPNRCSRTEGVKGSYIIRNRKPTYKAALKERHETFQAQLYGAGKSVTIPGSHILQNIKSRSDSFEDRVLQELSDEEAGRVGASPDASPRSVLKENLLSVCKTPPNPTETTPFILNPLDVPTVAPGSDVIHIPHGAQTKMVLWSILQDGFLKNTLQMWLTSPEIGSPRLYVSSSLKAPDVKCRNLRNWTGKTERGYPPLVAELMQQIPDESAGDTIRYGLMVRRADYWEVIGIRRRHRRPLVGQGGTKMIKFVKENAIMSVPLPTIQAACRWQVIDIDCHFDRIVFQGCVIIEKDIIKLSNVSQDENCVNSILFRENFPVEFYALKLRHEFGLYALPKISECVFLGPFCLESKKGDVVTMFKDVTAKGTDSATQRIFVEVVQPKSESSWLYAEGLLANKAKNSLVSLLGNVKVIAAQKAVVSQNVVKRIPNDSLVRRKLAAAVEHTYKSPINIGSSWKKRMVTPGLQRSRIGIIAAKKVAASRVFARRNFLANDTADTAKPSESQIASTSLIKKTSPLSLLKVALSVSKDDCEYPMPVDCAVEEIDTSPPEKISEVSPIMLGETVKLSPVKPVIQILSPPPVESQSEPTPCTVEVINSLSHTKKLVIKDVGFSKVRVWPPQKVDKDNPPPLSLLRSRPSLETLHSRTPSENHGRLPSGYSASEASSSVANVSVMMGNCPETTVTAPIAHRPGLTITGASSVVKAAADGCSKVIANNGQILKTINSNSDAEIPDCDIIVVPRTWQRGTALPKLSAEYEPAKINTPQGVEMSTLAVEGTTRVKYVPSIPSLGYVEAYRLPNNRLRIRFFNKTFVEVTVLPNEILQYLNKSICNNPSLRVEPPNLPLTWKVTEDMSSHPDVSPFNYAETFDGNHLLCEKGLLRKKVTPKAIGAREESQDVDVLALEHLKKVIGAPNICGVSLEETLGQAAAVILQCKRLAQDLQYKREWWQRRFRKTRKRFVRMVFSLPISEDQRLWFNRLEAIRNSAHSTGDDQTMEVIDLVDEPEDDDNDQQPNQDAVDISDPGITLSALTPRRIESILFPTEVLQPVLQAPISAAPKSIAAKQASLGHLTIQPALPTRHPVSLLRRNLYPKPPSVQTVIPLMDLTDDSAQPKVFLQKQPELPVVILDDDDDDQRSPPKPTEPSDKVTKPKVVYSYGVDNVGNFFRCAIINDKIVNKVRITKVPDNTECIKINPPNDMTSMKNVSGNASGSIGSTVNGTQLIGIGLADAVQQANQVANDKVFVIGSSDVVQSYGQKKGAVPISTRLAVKVDQTSSVFHTSGSVLTRVQVAHPMIQSSQTVNGDIIILSPPISNAHQPVAGTVTNGEDATEVPNAGIEDAPIISDVERVRAVFDHLISEGKLKGNTRQIMIKGPMFTTTPNILKRAPIKTKTTNMKDVHVELITPRPMAVAMPMPRPKAMQTEKQFVKISAGELQRINSLTNKVHPGKPITLKIKTTLTESKIDSETYEKDEGSLSDSTSTIEVKVGSEKSLPADNLTELPAAVADEDNFENLIIDEDAEGDLDTGVELDRCYDANDAKQTEDLCKDTQKSDVDTSQFGAEIVANDNVKTEDPVASFNWESVDDVEICEPILEESMT